jgi:hypothetical protein
MTGHLTLLAEISGAVMVVAMLLFFLWIVLRDRG